ncbi:hypothetical protein JL721_744 [Aureococcus anophagefferens]|nr:hypothetical protein JL721_744 [Aureococcus anophagefferens]
MAPSKKRYRVDLGEEHGGKRIMVSLGREGTVADLEMKIAEHVAGSGPSAIAHLASDGLGTGLGDGSDGNALSLDAWGLVSEGPDRTEWAVWAHAHHGLGDFLKKSTTDVWNDGEAWHPRPDGQLTRLAIQSRRGRAALLSTLRVVCTRREESLFERFVENLAELTCCPPAVLAAYAIRKRKAVSGAQTRCLATALFSLARSLLPESVKDAQRLPGGPDYEEGTFDDVTDAAALPRAPPLTRRLALLGSEVSRIHLVNSEAPAFEGAVAARGWLASVWDVSKPAFVLKRSAEKLVTLPPLCLQKNAFDAPRLCVDEERLPAVFLGTVACGSGLQMFRPHSGNCNFDPHELAKKLGDTATSAAASTSARDIKEMIVCCIDTSNSMSKSRFSAAAPAADPGRIERPAPRADDVVATLHRFRRSRPFCFGVLRSRFLAGGSSQRVALRVLACRYPELEGHASGEGATAKLIREAISVESADDATAERLLDASEREAAGPGIDLFVKLCYGGDRTVTITVPSSGARVSAVIDALCARSGDWTLWETYRLAFGSKILDVDDRLDAAGVTRESTLFQRAWGRNVHAPPSHDAAIEAVLTLREGQPGQSVGGTTASRSQSRMTVTKQLFGAFLDRTQAHDLPHELALVSFDSAVTVRCELTHLYEKFRDTVNALRTDGDTACYDAIAQAVAMIVARRAAMTGPAPAARIVVFTDGLDTSSKASVAEVAKALSDTNVVLDVLTIATTRSRDLLSLAKLTGGYAVAPASLEDGLLCMQMETMLSTEKRAAVRADQDSTQPLQRRLALAATQSWDVVDSSTVPEIRQHEALGKRATSVDALFYAPRMQAKQAKTAKSTRSKRLMRELRMINDSPHESIDVYPCEDDLSFWKAVIEGPDGLYAGATFLLSLEFPADYPSSAPCLRFLTEIRHVNVNRHGRVCHAILEGDYGIDVSVRDILSYVYGLLLCPDAETATDSNLASLYFEHPERYKQAVTVHTNRAKQKSRADWETERLG